AAFRAGHAFPLAGARPRQAAISAQVQRVRRVAPDGPYVIARQPARQVVALDETATTQLAEPAGAGPDRAFAIDEQRPARGRRPADRAVEQPPVTVLAIGDAAFGTEQRVAARTDRHRGGDTGPDVAIGQAVAQIGGAGRVSREKPQVRRRADPQRALAIAQHAIDAGEVVRGIAAELDAVPCAIALGELNARAVRDDQAA